MEIPYFVCTLFIESDRTLEEVGNILSKKLFAGSSFGGKEQNIRDEFPAIFIKEPIFGLKIVLYEVLENKRFILEMYMSNESHMSEIYNYKKFRINSYIASLIGTIRIEKDYIVVTIP